MSLNVWCFTGRLGRDAETKYLQSGNQVLEFSAAVDVGYGDKKTTIWPKCALFGERGGKIEQYLKKGTQVAVSGEINLREWKNSDGETKTSLEVRVDKVELIGSKNNAQPAQQEQPPKPAPKQHAQNLDDDDDIPF